MSPFNMLISIENGITVKEGCWEYLLYFTYNIIDTVIQK